MGTTFTLVKDALAFVGVTPSWAFRLLPRQFSGPHII
jgi:hypothetical protein